MADNSFSRWKEWRSPNGFTIVGHSRAAYTTSFYVKETKWMLDCGPRTVGARAKHVFITHCHLDHSYSVPFLLTHEWPLNIYVPAESARHLEAFMLASHHLNSNSDNPSTCEYKIHAVTPGMELHLDRHYFVKVVKCDHTVPTVGYLFFEKRSKLRDEFKTLPGKEIAHLRRRGEQIDVQTDAPLLAFMGDTTSQVFLDHPEILQYPVCIVECSFLGTDDETIQLAARKKHMCWGKLREVVAANPQVTFVLIHFSLRHSDKQVQCHFDQSGLGNIVAWLDEYPEIGNALVAGVSNVVSEEHSNCCNGDVVDQ